MGLGWSAVTLAGHSCLVMAVVMIFWNALMTYGATRGRTGPDWIALSVILLGVGAVVERLYYVLARLLVNTDYNLWNAHPAPDLLSAIVALLAFAVAVTVRVTARQNDAGWKAAIIVQSAALSATFVSLSYGLW